MIGRSLRAVTNLPALGERQITLDCDVLQADGGTRTAAITGAWVALHDCLKWMHGRSIIKDHPLRDHVAAISCGISNGEAVLDLDYEEDSAAETDVNFVMTGGGSLVEVQATAEAAVFTDAQLQDLLALAKTGIAQPSSSCKRPQSLNDLPQMMIAAAKLASRAGQLDNRRTGARTRRPLSTGIISQHGCLFDLTQCREADPVVNYYFAENQTNDH